MEDLPEASSSSLINFKANFPGVNSMTWLASTTFYKSPNVLNVNTDPFYGYNSPSITNIQSSSFGLGNYIMKVIPQTYYSYNLISSKL